MTTRGVNSYLIRPISEEEQQKRGWKLEVNGAIAQNVSSARLFNEKMGIEFVYGMRAEGYDGIVTHEPGGGGSVLVPYVIFDNPRASQGMLPDDILWVGLLEQERKTQGGKVLNLPRGYLNPGETHFETALREFAEETGYTADVSRVQDLCGGYAQRGNPNSAYFDTSIYMGDRSRDGVQYYGIEFFPNEFAVTKLHPDDPPVLALKKEIVRPVENDPMAERIFSCYFYPWDVAAGIADQFTNSGFSRLLKYLKRTRKFSIFTPDFVTQKLF